MKRSVLDYLENTAKRCPERLAWDASAPFTFGQWWTLHSGLHLR